MKPHLRPLIAVFCTLISSAAIGACLDFTAIPAAPSDAGKPDVMATDVDAADKDIVPCRSCVESPACSDTFAVCAATPKCVAMFECGAVLDCYEPGGNLVACLSICGQQAGLTDSTDPAVAPFLTLYQCATTQCAPACAVP
jgi:hypothetical protein